MTAGSHPLRFGNEVVTYVMEKSGMNTRHALVRLVELQSMILSAIDETERSMRAGGAAAQPHAARQRWALMRTLREYQLFKHIEIFDPVIDRGDPRRAELAEAIKQRCIAAGEDYRRYVGRWTSEATELRWADYVADADAVAARIRLHMARERRDVEALLAGMEQTRRPAARATISGSAAT